MKKLVSLLVFLLLIIHPSLAQNETCDCKKDLDFVVEKMTKMPSFKKQIKGDDLDAFNLLYSNLSLKMNSPISIEMCYKLLQQQMMLVNDIHSNLDINSNYKSIEGYNANLQLTLNLDELKEKLATKKLTAIEGLYNYGDKLVIGVFYNNSDINLTGVVLESKLDQWNIGDIKFTANHTGGSKYNVYHYDTDTKKPSIIKSLTLENGRLWSYKKQENTANEELPIKDQTNWEFKQLNETTQYLYFGHFGNSKKKEHIAFFEDVKNKLTAENIIVDLRSNGGGNKKFSDVYLKLLKDKNVYVLTNCFTGSNGEQFTVKLKALKNGKQLGQTTRGIISYGMNYGYTFNTPSGYFSMTPTDMNFHEFYDYEGKGVSPDITLDFDNDWVEQTLEIINKSYK